MVLVQLKPNGKLSNCSQSWNAKLYEGGSGWLNFPLI